MAMGKKYLNKNVRFKCQCGNAVWFKPQKGSFLVKIAGNDSLLNDCTLSIVGGVRPGQCNLIMTQAGPAPCANPVLSGLWNDMSTLQVGHHKVLTSGCSMLCPVGGMIVPFRPTLSSLTVDDSASRQGVTISLNYNQADNANKQAGTSNSSNEASGSPEANGDSPSFQEQTHSDQREKSLAENEEPDNVEYALCDYKHCEKSKTCIYLKTSSCLKETNESVNANMLKINLGKDSFDLYAGECSKIATASYGSYMYSIAHHHIIPANQCFKDFPEIVKLANYYGYDINKAENGICLPTMKEGYDNTPFEERKEVAFNAMRDLGRQWHKGGHQYSCSISADLDSILPRPFTHYKDAVDELLVLFQAKLNEDIKCRAENYALHAEEFTKSMDHICVKIARYLRCFESDSKKSYPFYVSKLAFYFAFHAELADYEGELFFGG